MLIKWKEEYSVNVKEIDEQHQHLISMINQLYKNISNVSLDEILLAQTLDELIEFAKNHFGTEEKYFDKFGYPEAEHHKSIHRLFTEKISLFKEGYKNKKVKISFYLIDFLEDWFLNHLASEDKKYTKFFNEHGLY